MEQNDIFAVANAVPAIALILYGFLNEGKGAGMCYGAGLGITIFGIAYMYASRESPLLCHPLYLGGSELTRMVSYTVATPLYQLGDVPLSRSPCAGVADVTSGLAGSYTTGWCTGASLWGLWPTCLRSSESPWRTSSTTRRNSRASPTGSS